MRTGVISIVTGWGAHLGYGHIQRMATLVRFLNEKKGIPSYLVSEKGPALLPVPLQQYVSSFLHPDTSCVIRDMRDSSVAEIAALQQKAPVIAIDDCGPGREIANRAIDLLPNLKYPLQSKESFIYGCNFEDSLRRIGGRTLAKGIDIAVYCGYDPSPGRIDFFVSLVPPQRSCVLLIGSGPRLVKDRRSSPVALSYAELLASSRVLLSHFGITLYEGFITGCRLIAVNPTPYHSDLADMVCDDIGVVNLGTEPSMDRERAIDVIESAAANPAVETVNTGLVLEKIDSGMEAFFSRVRDLCQS